MRFCYASYEVAASARFPDGLLHRPQATVEIIGPQGSLSLEALVDTGSDETIFPIALAEMIGVSLDQGAAGSASAVGGNVVRIVPGNVVLSITQGIEAYRWSATVGLLDVGQPEDEVALLGYSGFLEFFTATFNSQHRCLDLTPNDRLARA